MIEYILLLILILFLIICYTQSENIVKQNSKTPRYENIPPNVPIIDREIVNKLIVFLGQVLEDYKEAELFGYGGTALGCLRHKNIIPWDDDIDLGMDESKIPLFLQISKDKGYKIEEADFGYKILNEDSFIDIFIFGDVDGKYNMINEKSRQMFPRDYFLNRNEVYPIRYGQFAHLTIPIPNKIKEHCDRSYPNWEKVFKIQYPHYYKTDNYIDRYIFYWNPFIPKTILIEQ